jgi:Raf kinase inhibitor-like YbhB/YbcL family protein
MAFQLSSPAFTAGSDIPSRFTCDGEDVPPPLTWTGAPAGTQSFVLIVDDPDAPRGTFTHWVLFDIPATDQELRLDSKGKPVGISGKNSMGNPGYMGPCPPSGTHRYYFRLFALDVPTLGVNAGASREQVEHAMAQHTIAAAELMGRYSRR